MTKQELFERIKGKVIVSCQAVPGEPLYVEEKSIMYLMARAAKQAGTPMIRTSSVRDVVAIKEETGLPVIGLIQVQYDGFVSSISEFIREVREKYPDAVLMADISTYEEGVNAWKLGMDLVGTTMSGYTAHSVKLDGPDYELVRKLSATVDIPVIGEGRVHSPGQAVEMLDAGAYAVVVGGAITRPLEIAQRFIRAVEGR